MVSTVETDKAVETPRENTGVYDYSTRYVSPAVAHELNNVLTIIQGFADRLLLQHRENPDLQPHVKMISQAARRAATIVREATASNADAIQQLRTSRPVETSTT
jgi:signal transduction histidine kinase